MTYDGFLRIHRLGFRCNPYRTLADDEWVEVAVLPEEVSRVLRVGGAHLQVLGAAGRGKSTTLRALAARLGDEGRRTRYEYLPEGQSSFTSEMRGLELFCLDEAQRLAPGERSRLMAGARDLRLVLGSHEDLTGLFQRAELSLATACLDRASDAHFRAVLERRLEYFALPGAARVSFTPGAMQRLWERFGSDLRSAERLLYELFQRLEEAEPITPEMVERCGAVA